MGMLVDIAPQVVLFSHIVHAYRNKQRLQVINLLLFSSNNFRFILDETDIRRYLMKAVLSLSLNEAVLVSEVNGVHLLIIYTINTLLRMSLFDSQKKLISKDQARCLIAKIKKY